MRLFVTGIPGSGKTTLARALAKKLGYRVFSDKALAKKAGLLQREGNDWVANETGLAKVLYHEVKRHDNAIFEGHLLCEASSVKGVDWMIVIACDAATIAKRLQQRRGYSWVKILDNAWLSQNQYCEKRVKKNFGQRVIRVDGAKPIKVLVSYIVSRLKKKKKGS